jgi:hypothetical protein
MEHAAKLTFPLPGAGEGVTEFTGLLLAMLASCSGYRRVHMLLLA